MSNNVLGMRLDDLATFYHQPPLLQLLITHFMLRLCCIVVHLLFVFPPICVVWNWAHTHKPIVLYCWRQLLPRSKQLKTMACFALCACLIFLTIRWLDLEFKFARIIAYWIGHKIACFPFEIPSVSNTNSFTNDFRYDFLYFFFFIFFSAHFFDFHKFQNDTWKRTTT